MQPIIPIWRKHPFDDPSWLFEFKYNGFRGLCYLEEGRCRFISRNGNSLTRFDALADQVGRWLSSRAEAAAARAAYDTARTRQRVIG